MGQPHGVAAARIHNASSIAAPGARHSAISGPAATAAGSPLRAGRFGMNYRILALAFLLAVDAFAQMGPASSGYCSVSPTGLEGCNWMSGLNAKTSPLFVTRYHLAPGAPLAAPVPNDETLIVAMSDGELVNESKSPQPHIDLSNGSVFLMPKNQSYRLRNVGKDPVDLLLIRIGR